MPPRRPAARPQAAPRPPRPGPASPATSARRAAARARAPAASSGDHLPGPAAVELAPQPLERARQPRLDRSRPAAERLRRLALGEVEQVAAGDDGAVALVERPQRGEQLAALAAP